MDLVSFSSLELRWPLECIGIDIFRGINPQTAVYFTGKQMIRHAVHTRCPILLYHNSYQHGGQQAACRNRLLGNPTEIGNRQINVTEIQVYPMYLETPLSPTPSRKALNPALNHNMVHFSSCAQLDRGVVRSSNKAK